MGENDVDERIRHAWRYHGPAKPVGDDDRRGHACSKPLEFLNGVTGEVISIRCKTRSEKQCPGCSWLYKTDTAKILRDGLAGEGCRFFFLTLTAPSFGRTHVVPKHGRPRPCSCGRWHDSVRDADLRGVPVDCDEYDYDAQAFFNYHIGRLWDSARAALRKLLPDMVYAKIFEWQQRGALHVHVIIRVPAKDFVGGVGDAAETVLHVARSSTTMDGRLFWGEQCRCDEIRGDGGRNTVIGYLKKAVSYVCKDVMEDRPDGRPSRAGRHLMLLDMAARSMHCDRCRARLADIRARVEEGCGADLGDSLVALQRYMRIVSGLPACRALAHRRWGARSGVMSVSRRTRRREGWSVNGLTRKRLAEHRRLWWREACDGDSMTRVLAVLRNAGVALPPD